MSDVLKKNVIDAETEAAASPDKGGAAPFAATGLSNTRCRNTSRSDLNVCVDYLKVRFDGTFMPNDESCLQILDPLKVKSTEFDIDKGVSGYAKKYVFDENVVIAAGGETTRNSEGKETWFLELQGSSCRDFELRGGDWKELIGAVIRLGGKATRCDFAIDDFSGCITLEQLKQRIYKHYYSSPLRRMVMDGEIGLLRETDEPEIVLSKNEGFTANFGGRSTKQLCIYNKKAERASKEYLVTVNSWVRYEARFYHEAAESALVRVYTSMIDDSFQTTVAGLVGGLVDFKENLLDKNLARNPTWTKWSELLHDVAVIKIQNQARKELTLAKKHDWFMVAAGPTLAKVFLANPGEFMNFIGYVVYRASQKLDHKAVASVNYLRKRYNKKSIDFDEAVEELDKAFGKSKELSPYLASLLKRIESDEDTGEIGNEER